MLSLSPSSCCVSRLIPNRRLSSAESIDDNLGIPIIVVHEVRPHPGSPRPDVGVHTSLPSSSLPPVWCLTYLHHHPETKDIGSACRLHFKQTRSLPSGIKMPTIGTRLTLTFHLGQIIPTKIRTDLDRQKVTFLQSSLSHLRPTHLSTVLLRLLTSIRLCCPPAASTPAKNVRQFPSHSTPFRIIGVLEELEISSRLTAGNL